MSSESLSQDQIDVLFGDDAPSDASLTQVSDPSQDVQIYDFRRPSRISKDRNRSLLAMYGLLTKSFENWVSGRIRDQIELRLQSVEQLSFGEFTLALPSLCASYIVNVHQSSSQGVIDFGHEFGYFIIDRLLGGSSEYVVPDRPFTQTERLVVGIVADRVAYQLTEVWKDHVKLDLKVDGFESIPEMLQIANREDPVLVANIAITMGTGSSVLLLCLPFTTVEKYFTGASDRPQVTQGNDDERNADREIATTSVLSARLSVGARLPTFHVPIKTLAAIEPGGVLETGLSPDSHLELNVAGQHRFMGIPGRIGQSLAVQVTEIVQPEPENLIGPARTQR